jgi:TM2 domain-containing membrane protein YozV
MSLILSAVILSSGAFAKTEKKHKLVQSPIIIVPDAKVKTPLVRKPVVKKQEVAIQKKVAVKTKAAVKPVPKVDFITNELVLSSFENTAKESYSKRELRQIKKQAKKDLKATAPKGGHSQLIALLLALLLGGLSAHRWYLGYYWQAVVQIITFGGFGIWWLIDVIRIVTGDLQPKDGSYSDTF